MKAAIILAAVIGLLTCGCGPKRQPCTDPGATRCNGSTVEICDPNKEWSPHSDCAEMVPGEWNCAEDAEEGLSVCTPAGEPAKTPAEVPIEEPAETPVEEPADEAASDSEAP